MTAMSYPYTSCPPWAPSYHDVPLRPVEPPPEALLPSPPVLPYAPRQPTAALPYTLTTHIIPAAFIRSGPDIPAPSVPVGKSKEETLKLKQELSATIVQSRQDLENHEQSHKKILWNCLNRYTRKGSLKHLYGKDHGITLFFAHANGVHKETWETTLHHLGLTHEADLIEEIWTWEAVQHGDAGLLNVGNLAGIFDWTDNCRDILNFLLNYLPAAATSTPPTHLTRLPHAETEERKAKGYSHRTLVVVGHSFGGCSSALAALEYPKLFSSLILVDPVLIQPNSTTSKEAYPNVNRLTLGALLRREEWPSRKEAFLILSKSPFFGAWDKDVLKNYIDLALYPASSATIEYTAVRLKMPGIQEAIVFADVQTANKVWERIERLDKNIALRWVVPGKPGAPDLGGTGATQTRVWRRPENSTNIRIAAGGHLIPQEAPLELAKDIAQFLEGKYVLAKANL